MAKKLLSSRAERGRTFTIAMWVVGLVLSLQALLAGWALIARPEASRQAYATPLAQGGNPIYVNPALGGNTVPVDSNTNSPPAVGEGGSTVPFQGKSNENGPSTGGLDPVAGATLKEGIPSAARMEELNAALEKALEGAPPIPGSILERLVGTAEELRKNGNMQGALQALLQAENAAPDHPRILSQLAATYMGMGVKQTSDEYWKQVISLGSVAAGPYFSIADRVLRPESLIDDTAALERPAAPEPVQVTPVLSIGEVKVDEQDPGEAGQRVSLRIVVDAIDGEKHAGEDLALFVYFYDLVNGSQILESTADTSYLYPTEPYDWDVNGREEIVVNYNQPRFSPEEEVELGSRTYYGYAIQLYYRDILQDRLVKPSEILKLRLDPPELTAPLGGFRGGAQPERVGPENALFPLTPDL